MERLEEINVFVTNLKLLLRPKPAVSTIEISSGLGPAYDRDSNTFHILNAVGNAD